MTAIGCFLPEDQSRSRLEQGQQVRGSNVIVELLELLRRDCAALVLLGQFMHPGEIIGREGQLQDVASQPWCQPMIRCELMVQFACKPLCVEYHILR